MAEQPIRDLGIATALHVTFLDDGTATFIVTNHQGERFEAGGWFRPNWKQTVRLHNENTVPTVDLTIAAYEITMSRPAPAK